MFSKFFNKCSIAPSATPSTSANEEEDFVKVTAKYAESKRSTKFVMVDRPPIIPTNPPEPSSIIPIYTESLLEMNIHLRAIPSIHATIRSGVRALHDISIILSKYTESIADQRTLAMRYIGSLPPGHQRALALVIGLILNLDASWPAWDRSTVQAQEFDFGAAVWLLRLGPCGVTWKFEQNEGMMFVLDVLLVEEEIWVKDNEDGEGWEDKKAELSGCVKELWEWAEGLQVGRRKVAKGSAVRKLGLATRHGD
ncbi:hypothetical protein FB567DRAFT_609834 [Paraphoma chrysanthemicola]|uniref:Uncharacterized protein n=1 Tax=Paraphoma chrysanthemicola TaxID=798071 RepID=A0A8K0RD53_9PLEO|nr:hypothetical protein FB567DRAFT_609834 [Paraphoma chrysanthemicola]